MISAPSGIRLLVRNADPELLSWLQSFGTFTHAVTLTFLGQNPSNKDAQAAVKIFINRLNRECFGHAYRRGRRSLAVACAIEAGSKNLRQHAHLAIGAPTHQTEQKFRQFIRLAKRQTKLVGDVQVTAYRDSGWLTYITKQGLEALDPQCCFRAR